MNHTSTRVPMWQIDCEEFKKTGRVFELRDVSTPDHEEFVNVWSKRHQWGQTRDGNVVTFHPPE